MYIYLCAANVNDEEENLRILKHQEPNKLNKHLSNKFYLCMTKNIQTGNFRIRATSTRVFGA